LRYKIEEPFDFAVHVQIARYKPALDRCRFFAIQRAISSAGISPKMIPLNAYYQNADAGVLQGSLQTVTS
jgi:hypothetical protein